MVSYATGGLRGIVFSVGVFSAGVFFAISAAGTDGDPRGWLDARQLGASGSTLTITASTTAGSKQIVVAGAGDFRPGQGVTISKCNVGYTRSCLRTRDEKQQPLGDAVELRGYDGSAGSWLVYVLDIDGADPATFRWSDDLARSWAGTKVPITYDWQPLGGGTEIRFSKRRWQPGEVIHFHARDQLVTTIEKVEGKTFALRDAANRTVTGAVLRHCDGAALQAAIDRAVKEKRNLRIPAGRYRLARGLTVSDASGITIEGASGEGTVLDISEGDGACFRLRGGVEVTIRNFRMIGHTGMAARVYSFRPTQVVVRDNLFVNFNRGAIAISGATRPPPKESFPAHSAIVTGNIIDLTCTGDKPLERTGIEVSATGVIAANNQVYVRGQADPTTTGIRVCEPALDVLVHGNLVRNCGAGLVGSRVQEAITEVVDPATFLSSRNKLPMEWGYSHRYRGWNLAWISGGRPGTRTLIDSFDPLTMRFKLRQPQPLKIGDRFEVFPPSANWNIHGNTITGCLKPVVLDSYGSPTSIFRDNLIARGEAKEVKQPIEVRGQFQVTGNQVFGFEEAQGRR